MLELYNFYTPIDYNLLFNINKFKKLKHLKIKDNDFLKYNFENTILQNIEFIDYFKIDTLDDKFEEMNIIKKLLLIKTLKNINCLSIKYLNSSQIYEAGDYNGSIKKLKLTYHTNNGINFYTKIFPNLTDLNIELHGEDTSIQISEDNNSKINKLSIIYFGGNLNIFCQSFENLIELEVLEEKYIDNITNFFPIFNNICKVIFHSLIKFKFKVRFAIDNNAFINLYNNLDCLPVLEEFEYFCVISKGEKNFVLKFIKKLLEKRIKSTILCTLEHYIQDLIFTNEELKKINPEIDFSNYNCLKIYKGSPILYI